MHLLIPPPDHPPFKTQRCQVTPPHTLVFPHMRQERGQDTLGQEAVEVILPRATLHREETPPRREARHRVTLRLTLPEAETLLGQGTLQATPQLTPQVTLLEERVTLQIGVGILPLEHLRVEAALLVTLPLTLLAELILPAIHLPIHQKEVTLLATLRHILPVVEKPQAIPPLMHQMKGKPRALPQLILLKVKPQVILPRMHLKELVLLLTHLPKEALLAKSPKMK